MLCFLATLTICGTANPAAAQNVATQAGQSAASGNNWFVQADALFLERSNASDEILVSTGGDSGFPQPVVTIDDLGTDFESGLRLSVGRLVNSDQSLEVAYFGLQSWGAEFTVSDPPPDTETLFGGEFTVAHFVTRSELHNAEINLRRHVFPSGRFSAATLVGVRYLSFKDRFVVSQDLVDTMDSAGFRLFDINADNDLIGAQLGGDFLFSVTRRLRFGASGKAGLLLNLADLETIIDSRDIGTIIVGDSNERLAGIVEVGLTATWQVTPNLAVRGGYQVIYVGGLALAPENYDPLSLVLDPHLKDNGDLVLDGPSAGLEAAW